MYYGPKVPPGSLLKQPGNPKKGKKFKPTAEGQREPRKLDAPHLEAIRQCPCLACGADPAGEAAHLRLSAPGKPNAGVGAKPDDKWTLPLCHACHMQQHQTGENSFWRKLGLDPFVIAPKLYKVSPNIEAMRALCIVAKEIGGKP